MKRLVIFILALFLCGCEIKEVPHVANVTIESYNYEGDCYYNGIASNGSNGEFQIFVKEKMSAITTMQVNDYDTYLLVSQYRDDKDKFSWRIKVTDSSYFVLMNYDIDENHFVKLHCIKK